MSSVPEYEFSDEQNALLGNLAGKMRYVGLFSVLFGVFALLLTLVLVLFINRDRLPADFRAKAAEYYKQAQETLPPEAKEYTLDKIPSNNTFLTGVAIFTGVVGLIFLLQGSWSRSSAASFQQIVDSQGNDISHLMNAVRSLQNMYGMVSTLLTLALLAAIVAVGLSVYQHFTTV
jgi:hypothetical protein